jgi:plasmid stabilization system protein ParE
VTGRTLLTLVVRPKARGDVFAITDNVALQSLELARNLDHAFADRFERLCITGPSLRFRPEFGRAIRAANFKGWLILFRVTETELIVLRVLHGSMHPKRLAAAAKSE